VNSLLEMNVVVVPDKPRYQLPPDLAAILPWPMAQEFNTWAKSFLGMVNDIPDNEIRQSRHTIFCNPRMYERIKREFKPARD
jgi:hypothetical protein